MSKFDPIMYVPDDGLELPEIGIWALKKYKLLGMYCDIFTSGMKNKWDQLVYIDLFAGAGCAKVKQDGKILKTSSLIAAAVPHPFSHYVICEENPVNLSALQQRLSRDHPDLHPEFVLGDSNKNISAIIEKIPKSSNALRFCFVDPFSLNLEFETIKRISAVGKMDFLILLALQMDGKRNLHNYISENSNKVDQFIGSSEWRKPFQEGRIPEKQFIRFLAEQYDANMQRLGYIVNPKLKFEVRTDNNNLPLYYLAFYSKNDKGNEFYEKIEKYQSLQLKMF